MTLPANRRFGLGVDRKFTSLFCAVAALAIIGLFAWPNPDRVAEAADVFINQNNEDTIGEDLFDTVTANGDRLYEAGEYDRAIELYEQAYALRPNNVNAAIRVTGSHIRARQGDITVHL